MPIPRRKSHAHSIILHVVVVCVMFSLSASFRLISSTIRSSKSTLNFQQRALAAKKSASLLEKEPAKKAKKLATTKGKETTTVDTVSEEPGRVAKRLVIVESPAKARTIQSFLGANSGYIVDSCMGHVRDLPASASQVPSAYKKEKWATVGVNTENGSFHPLYVVTPAKKPTITRLRALADECDEVILATDEDREGEAISWHLLQVLQPQVPVSRAVFHEITKDAVQKAFSSVRDIDYNLVQAQEARRILDRLAGYTMSPLLWKKIAPSLSAGRVQSVGLAMIVNREMQRLEFNSAEYWDVKANLTMAAGSSAMFSARLTSVGDMPVATSRDFDSSTGLLKKEIEGKVIHLTEESVIDLANKLASPHVEWTVTHLEAKKGKRNSPIPFITSTLQQAGNNKLGLSTKVTMMIAQELYEEGLITYMRTDNPNLSKDALQLTSALVTRMYGEDTLKKGAVKKNKMPKGSQEAHEAIRPAAPEAHFVPPSETGLEGNKLALYELIFMRTMASVMNPAELEYTTLTIQATGKGGENLASFRMTGKQILNPGWMRAYEEDPTENSTSNGAPDSDSPSSMDDVDGPVLPKYLVEGSKLSCTGVTEQEHHTKPPARFTEASFVKELEANGVGRPSTYASITETLKERKYVQSLRNTLAPSLTAVVVTNLLTKYFPDFVDTSFTARMEHRLDEIARGVGNRTEYLNEYYNGEDGLKNKVNITEELIQPNEARRALLPTLKQLNESVGVYVGPYGAFVEQQLQHDEHSDAPITMTQEQEQLSEGGEFPESSLRVIRSKIPLQQHADLELLTVESVNFILEVASGGGKDLGIHPETGEKVLMKIGRFGPYIEMGTKRVTLAKTEDLTSLTFERGLQYLSLPRLVCQHPDTGKDIKAGIGRFGQFVMCDGLFKSIPPSEDVFTIGPERAQELIAIMEKTKKVLLDLGTYKDKPIRIVKGRFGAFVQWNGVFGKLPKEYMQDPTSVPYEIAVAAAESKLKGTGGTRGRPKKSGSEPKPLGVKRPRSAFILFSSAMRPVLKEQGLTLIGEVAKELAVRWKNASPEVKAEFEALRDKDRERWEEEKEKLETETLTATLNSNDDEEDDGLPKKKKVLSKKVPVKKVPAKKVPAKKVPGTPGKSKLTGTPGKSKLTENTSKRKTNAIRSATKPRTTATKAKLSVIRSKPSTANKRLTGYMVFSNINRGEVGATVSGRGAVMKELASLWREKSQEEKEAFDLMAKEESSIDR